MLATTPPSSPPPPPPPATEGRRRAGGGALGSGGGGSRERADKAPRCTALSAASSTARRGPVVETGGERGTQDGSGERAVDRRQEAGRSQRTRAATGLAPPRCMPREKVRALEVWLAIQRGFLCLRPRAAAARAVGTAMRTGLVATPLLPLPRTRCPFGRRTLCWASTTGRTALRSGPPSGSSP